MRSLVILFLFCAAGQAFSQAWADKLVKGLGEAGSKKRGQLDSIDFQMVISVNENAGFFDVQNKGEGGAKILYAARDKKDKSPSELARDTLEWAIQYYNLRMFKSAQEAFTKAQGFMEAKGMGNDISYLRCV